MKKYVSIILLLVLTGCPKVKKPPFQLAPVNVPIIEMSTISVPISVDIAKIEESIRREIENPVANGKTDEIDVKILATEQITERQLIKTLVKPAQPGYYVTKYKNVERKVKKAFKCLLKPWKWGSCYKDVIEVVKVPYEVWIEPVEAIYKYVSKDITSLIDAVFDISGWINYKVYVRSFDLGINGNNLNANTKFKIELSLDYKQNAVPFGPDIKIKGALTCSIEGEIDINGNINLGEDADLIIEIPDDGGAINFTKICVPEAVEAFDIIALLNPVMRVVKDQIGKKLDEKLTEKIKEEINDSKGDLIFKEEILANAKKASQPSLIGEDVWLIPNLNTLEYTNIKGENGKLNFQLAIKCRPEVVYAKSEPSVDGTDASFEVKKVGTIDPATEILIDAAVAFDEAEQELDSAIKAFQKDKYEDIPYYLANPQFYPSNNRMVISLDLNKKKNKKRKLRLYVWGVPKYDAEKSEIYLDSVGFTSESKSVILKFLTVAFENQIIEEIEKSSRWNISEDKQKILEEIKEIEYVNKNFVVSGGFPELDLTEVFVTKDSFKFFVKATGEITMVVDPLGSAEMTSELKALNSLESVINPQFAPGQAEGFMPNANKMMGAAYVVKPIKSAKMPADSIVESIKVSLFEDLIIKAGDTIYMDDNQDKYRIADTIDATGVGDTLFIESEKDSISYYIIGLQDLEVLENE